MAIVLLLALHRRHVVKLRREDANDKHRSLDFGLADVEASPAPNGKKKNNNNKKKKNVDMEEKPRRLTAKGMSLDMGGPYLMPPGLAASRTSLHSLSHSIHSSNDNKYHHHPPPPHAMSDDVSSLRVPGPRGDDASSYAASSADAHDDDMDDSLLGNAQRMSRSSPPILPAEQGGFQLDLPAAAASDGKRRSQIHNNYVGLGSYQHEHDDRNNNNVGVVVSDYSQTPDFPLPPSMNNAQQQQQQQRNSVVPGQQASSTQPPRISLPLSDVGSDYDDGKRSGLGISMDNLNGSANNPQTEEQQIETRDGEESEQPRLSVYDGNQDARRMTFGLRPLPPMEDLSEDPEQRANRIRSFYKEYFDPNQHRPVTGEFYEDYPVEFYGGAMYDPVTGEPIGIPAPYADPYGRRAMTPPPRAPPRFRSGRGTYGSGSTGVDVPSPRVFSSASGRFPGPNNGPRRKPLPPPLPLKELPTPHMLKDDFFMGSIDFAPGRNVKDRREGRPDTPTGGLRPYTPTTRVHTPLVSPFDELSAVPSP